MTTPITAATTVIVIAKGNKGASTELMLELTSHGYSEIPVQVVRASVSLSPMTPAEMWITQLFPISVHGAPLYCPSHACYSGRFRGCRCFTAPPKDGFEYSID